MYLQMVINLSLVLLLIFLYAIVLRYINRKRQGSTTYQMRILSTLALTAKEKMILVEVENQRLLLGVTSSQISLLTRIESEKNMQDMNHPTNFSQTLNQFEKTI